VTIINVNLMGWEVSGTSAWNGRYKWRIARGSR
jgi:hypothetical protein